jgi:hypothetical protein
MAKALTAVALAACLALSAGNASAASITYFLDQSNTEGTWPDGVNYLQVDIFDSITNPGDIEFLVTALAPLTVSAGTNFGIQAFGFNSNYTLTGANIVDPAGWTAGSGTLNGFGLYEVREAGNGGNRQNPLSFRITGVSGDTPLDYAVLHPLGGGGQGNYFFAAHVAGMTTGPGSAYFGGNATTVVPVPAAAWLLGSALGLLGWMRRRD